MTTTDRGAYTAVVQIGGKRYTASGQFGLNGEAMNVIPRTGLTPLTIQWRGLFDNSDQVTGFAQASDWVLPLGLLLNRSVYHATTNRAPQAGRYTVVLPGALAGSTDWPHGDSFGTVVVAPSGVITFAGTLADGTKVAQTVPVTRYNDWPLYASLYAGKGSVFGWVRFAPDYSELSNSQELTWIRPPITTTKFYPAGFSATTTLSGSRYAAPPVGGRILDVTNAFVNISGGNLSQDYSNAVFLGVNSRVTNAGPNKLTLTFAPVTGLFTGSFTPVGTTRIHALRGAVLQKFNYASGFFLGTNQVGRVTFEPPAPPIE